MKVVVDTCVRTSKFLSLILRHKPERAGLTLDSAGWAAVAELLEAVNRHGIPLTLDRLKHVVASNDKKRFAFSEDGLRIRASQGHSIGVDLQYEPQIPPEFLYRGTPERFIASIRATGLNKGQRIMSIFRPTPRPQSKSANGADAPTF